MRIGLAGPYGVRSAVEDEGVVLPCGYADATAWTPVNDLAAALTHAGHEVTVFTLSTHVTESIAVSAPNLKIRILPMRGRARERMRDLNRGEVLTLRRAFNEEALDIVHAHWSYEYALAAAHSTVPHLVTVHDCPPVIFIHARNAYRLLRMIVGVRGMRAARNLSTVSPYMVDCVRRITGRSPILLPNMLAKELVETSPRGGGRANKLLSVSNGFDGRKGGRRLLRVFAQVRRRCPSAVLSAVGHGWEPGGEAHGWASAHGVSDGVTFVGPLDRTEVLRAMDASDGFVHPAKEESFGMVIVEAMARGVPVVADHCAGAVPWVVGEAGILADWSRTSEAACAVCALLDDEALRRDLSSRGRAAVLDRFSYEVVLPSYLAAYSTILEADD